MNRVKFNLFCRRLYHLGFFEWITPFLTFLTGLTLGWWFR